MNAANYIALTKSYTLISHQGGEKGDGRATASCEAYDPETDTWKRSGMLPAPRKGHACVQAEKMLLASGGVQGKTAHKNLWYVRY